LTSRLLRRKENFDGVDYERAHELRSSVVLADSVRPMIAGDLPQRHVEVIPYRNLRLAVRLSKIEDLVR